MTTASCLCVMPGREKKKDRQRQRDCDSLVTRCILISHSVSISTFQLMHVMDSALLKLQLLRERMRSNHIGGITFYIYYPLSVLEVQKNKPVPIETRVFCRWWTFWILLNFLSEKRENFKPLSQRILLHRNDFLCFRLFQFIKNLHWTN